MAPVRRETATCSHIIAVPTDTGVHTEQNIVFSKRCTPLFIQPLEIESVLRHRHFTSTNKWSRKSQSMIYNLHFPTKMGGIPEGQFCQISGHVVSQGCWKHYLHLGFYSVRRCKRCALHFPSFFYYKRSFYPREEVQAEFPMIWLLKKMTNCCAKHLAKEYSGFMQ